MDNKNMKNAWFGLHDRSEDGGEEFEFPVPKHEPEPDDPDPDDETQDLVRPVKT